MAPRALYGPLVTLLELRSAVLEAFMGLLTCFCVL